MENKNTHREVETKSKIGHETNAFLRGKHPICRRGHHEKRSDYTKASWEVLSSPPGVDGTILKQSSPYVNRPCKKTSTGHS
jgi:hypothetical protein